jgi:hypothetical protein
VRTSSFADSNGATAKVLSETHTSDFAARPKPPPESPPAENSTPVTTVTRLGPSARSEAAIDCLRSALPAAPDYADAMLISRWYFSEATSTLSRQ